MSDVALHAWIDESMHIARFTHDGIYLLAAGVADPAVCDDIRDRLRRLLPRGKQRLHWREESMALKDAISKTIAACDMAHLVVVGTHYDHHRQERARRRCMERLFSELEQLGVEHAVLENRTPSLNLKDQEMFAALRGRGQMHRLRATFGLPSAEPMLWVPDAVAGAVGMDRRSLGSRPRDELGHSLQVIDIEV